MSPKELKMIVFDLDYTLWPFWVDTHVNPPFKKSPENIIKDMNGQKVKHYPEAGEVLKMLHDQGYILAVASRTSEINGANELIKLFGWDKYFTYKEIFPGRKTTHFSNIKKNSGIPYNQMMFFDDENRNIIDINGIGVTSILVEDGVNKKIVKEAVEEFKNNKQF